MAKKSLLIMSLLCMTLSLIVMILWSQHQDARTADGEKPSSKHFCSGFEGNVSLRNPNRGANLRWVQGISGLDSTTGFHWPDDLPGNSSKARFIYLVEGYENPNAVVRTAIDEVEGHNGTLTKALYQEVAKQYINRDGKYARNQFVILNNQDNDLREVYVRYWMKIQPNLESVMPADTWRQITEIRERNNEYRITLTIHRRNETEPLFWVLSGQSGPRWGQSGPRKTARNIDWIITNGEETNTGATVNRKLDVPIGEWFLNEFYVKQGAGDDGRFVWKVNGVTYADHQGRTSLGSGFWHWDIFKTYASGKALDAGKHYQWIDDFEITLGSGEFFKR